MRIRAPIAWTIAAFLAWPLPLSAQEAPAPAASPVASASAAEVPLTGEADEAAPVGEAKVKSLFFTREEVMSIRQAAASFKRKKGKSAVPEEPEDYLQTLESTPQEPVQATQYYTYPQFFLESLAYHSPKDWVVWFNNQKFTPENAEANTDIRILAIDKNQVRFEWRPSSSDRVGEMWKRAPGAGVRADPMRGTVEFSLHANQTFSSYVMRVLEGKVLPVTIDTSQEINMPPSEGSGPESAFPPIGASPAHAAPTQGSGKSEGLEGLIDSYQHMPGGKKQ